MMINRKLLIVMLLVIIVGIELGEGKINLIISSTNTRRLFSKVSDVINMLVVLAVVQH